MLQKGKGLMTDNNYGFVSNEIIRDGTLTPESRILYAILATYSNQDRKCYSTINELIKASGMCRTTFYRHMKSLEEKEIIKKYYEQTDKHPTHRKLVYELCDRFSE